MIFLPFKKNQRHLGITDCSEQLRPKANDLLSGSINK